MEEEIKKYIKEHLKLECKVSTEGRRFPVVLIELKLGGDVIDSSYFDYDDLKEIQLSKENCD